MHKYKLQGKKGEGTFSEVRRAAGGTPRALACVSTARARVTSSRATRARGAQRKRTPGSSRRRGASQGQTTHPRGGVAPAAACGGSPTRPRHPVAPLAPQVLKGTSLKSGKPVAIKCMKHVFDNVEQVNALREIQALKRLSPHPNIVKLHEVL